MPFQQDWLSQGPRTQESHLVNIKLMLHFGKI